MASPPSRLQPPKAGRRRRSLVSSPVSSSPQGAFSGSPSSLPPSQRRRLFHSSPPPGSPAEPRREPSESHRDGGCTALRAYTGQPDNAIGAEARDGTGKGNALVVVDSRPVVDGGRVNGSAQVKTEDQSKETGMSKGESLGDVREWSRERLMQVARQRCPISWARGSHPTRFSLFRYDPMPIACDGTRTGGLLRQVVCGAPCSRHRLVPCLTCPWRSMPFVTRTLVLPESFDRYLSLSVVG